MDHIAIDWVAGRVRCACGMLAGTSARKRVGGRPIWGLGSHRGRRREWSSRPAQRRADAAREPRPQLSPLTNWTCARPSVFRIGSTAN